MSGRHTGSTDVPLTDNGREQARRLGPLIARHHIAAAFVSPMRRARETAQLAGVVGAHVDADLSEWDYGGYEGITTVEIHRERPDWFLFTDGVTAGPPEHPGESPDEVGARAERMLAKIDAALSESEGSVVVVSHGHFLRVLTARRLGLTAQSGALFQLATGTMSRLSTEHRRHVVAGWNVRPDAYCSHGPLSPADEGAQAP